MNRLITTLFCFSLLALPAHAQERELSSGLNYTTMAKPKLPEAQKAEPAIEKAAEAVSDKSQAEEELDPATRVWNKYKDLATGKAGEEAAKQKAEIDTPEKPEKPEVAKPSKTTMNAKQAEVPKSGLGAILQEWKNTKQNQREMRSKSFKTPTAPEKEGG